MSRDELEQLLPLLRCPVGAIRAAVRVGSRVYGTATETSDYDYVVVLADRAQKRDLLFGPAINIAVHGAATFEEALAEQSVFAYEALFAPSEHTLVAAATPFKWKLELRQLAASALARSDADFDKAKKRMADEPGPSKKRLFHALRVPMFALELALTGKLTRFDVANDHHLEIVTNPSVDFSDYERLYGPLRDQLRVELERAVRAKR
jgi:hypothetical protein